MKKIITIVMMLIIIVLGIGVTYSMFISNASLNMNDQGIAKFIFNAEAKDNIQLSIVDVKPGDKNDYLFSVTNSDAGDVSDVTIEYQIIIKTYHFIPFDIKLYKIINDVDVLVMKCDETYPRDDQNELVCNVPIQEMIYSLVKHDDYKLEVSFPSEYNDPIYSGLVDFIDLEINSWQKTGN